MRKKFAYDLYNLMKDDEHIVLITADMGYGMLDRIKNDFPDRFFNVGVAEMAMMGMAVGMALEGKIPITYSITPFLLFRPFEVIRNYINHENIPVIMVGSGRDSDYKDGGFSHYAGDDDIIKQFENILFLAPEEEFDLSQVIYGNKPVYLNLKR